MPGLRQKLTQRHRLNELTAEHPFRRDRRAGAVRAGEIGEQLHVALGHLVPDAGNGR